jgi:ATP-dependent exoDNAse (exonuclease V) beta subunit
LVFREGSRWTIVDFKTHDDVLQQDGYAAQLSIYSAAIEASTGQEVANILMRI